MYRYKILDCSNNKKYQSSVIITLNSKLSTLNFFVSTLNSQFYCPPKRSKNTIISSHVLNSSLPHSITVPINSGCGADAMR